MKYVSTRSNAAPQSFEQVLLSGLAPDGGLYVPMEWPQLDLINLRGKSYAQVAEAVMYPFVQGSIARKDFSRISQETYSAQNFSHPDIAPLHALNDKIQILELFYGPTIAFKDVALQLLGRLFDHVLSRRNESVTIVGATSGDTGSAAIEGCRHSKYAKIFILHPHGRVSDVQRRQMTTVLQDNVHNIAIEGSFDDCQNIVKAMFNNAKFRAEMNLSAVNSINWARIMAQIVYYFTAGLAAGAPDKPVSFVVPTGNFGNVFAAYAARKMGLPIETLAIATNRNDILTRFFETGAMKAEDVVPTISPSMDIQISSNFERYLFGLLGGDTQALALAMNDFKTRGEFSVPPSLLQNAQKDFSAYRSSEAETMETMRQIYTDYGYILDPHTAVGVGAAQKIAKTASGPVISLATAHPAKFPDAVEKSIGQRPALPPHLADLFEKTEKFHILKNNLEAVQDYIFSNK
jgi:threonine synthase